MDNTVTLEQLVDAFQAGSTDATQLVAALDLLLVATGGNAVGIWRRVDHELRVLGFICDAAFPQSVATDFVAATKLVSLDQTGLGIVHATLTRQPAVALLPSQGGLLPGSGGWLERFGSVQSLSMPIFSGKTVMGVLALSTRFRFESADRTWKLLADLAPRLTTWI